MLAHYRGGERVPNDDFQELLAVMPDIAEAVNTFNSEAAQLKALKALIQTARNGSDRPVLAMTSAVASPPPPEQPPSAVELQSTSAVPALPPAPTEREDATSTAEVPTKKRRKSSTKKNFTVVRGLNFAPAGEQSLADFVAEKQPRTMHEKNLAACYYLQHIMNLSSITVGHVLAVYRECDWTAPSQPDTTLRNTAAAEGWIDTGNTKDIKVVWAGQNHIESKMPTLDPRKGKK
jgi:hypothetical protein